MGKRVHSRSVRWPWTAMFVGVTLALLAGVYAHYTLETERIRQAKYQDLSAIAQLKAGQIDEWRKERLVDAWRSANGPMFRRGLLEWLKDRNNTGLLWRLQERYVMEREKQGYDDVILFDLEGNILLSAKPNPQPLNLIEKQAVEEALAKRVPAMSDLYRSSPDVVQLDAVAPVLDDGGSPTAVVVMRINAESRLYPLIVSWPTPSRTAETLLVRREGEEVLFLSNLRHRPDPALSLRLPLALVDLPTAQAMLGRPGPFQGRDYRGVEVLADVRAIPGSPWFMVTKVDTSEILAEARYRGFVTVLFAGLSILLAAGVIAYGYRRRQARLYRKLYRSERNERVAEERFRTILYSIGDAVITTNTAGLVEQMNPVAERLTGWSEAEAKGKSLDDVFPIVSEDSGMPLENPVMRILREGTVVGLANHTLLRSRDGTERPIADSGAPIIDEKGSIRGVVLTFRDKTEERSVEKRLRESEELHRAIFEIASIGIDVVDAKGEFLQVNDALTKMLGYSRDELKKLSFSDMTHPEDIEASRVKHEDMVQGRTESYRMEKRYLTKDGRALWADLSVSAVRDPGGGYVATVGVISDITERKRAEAALLKSEERYRTIADFTYDWEYWVDPEDKLLYISPSCERITGYSAQEFLDDPALMFRVVHPDDHNEVMKHVHLARKVDPDPVYSIDFRIVRRDGQTRWVNHVCRAVHGQDGQPLGRRSCNRDITDRKRSELAQRRLATAVEQSVDAVVITDAQGNIEYVNPAFELATGYTREEVLGEKPSLLRREDYRRAHYPEISGALSRGESWRGRLVEQRKDGSFYEEDVTISPVRDASGKTINFVASKRDVSQEVQLQRQLMHAQKMEAVGTLAGGIAHDFNNLLQVTLGYSELLLVGKTEQDSDYDDLKKIHQAARNGAELVQGLLAFSRNVEPKPVPLNLNNQIRQVQKILGRTIPRMIDIRLELAEDLKRVNGDPAQMEQILMNVAVNARDAMPDGGTLAMVSRNATLDEDYCRLHADTKPGDYVLLSVSDTGQGMDAQTLEHIFEPFFTTKDLGGGTGLGLAMVYGIAKQHGGHVTCYSEVGKGTEFRLYLPAISTGPEIGSEPLGEHAQRGTETVLLVDDEDMVRELGERILKANGYTVLTATNGPEALDLYVRHKGEVAIVILDLIMPVMSGHDCLKEILKIDPQAKVVLASGYSTHASSHDFSRLGAKGFVAKPFGSGDLLRQVRKTLDEN